MSSEKRATATERLVKETRRKARGTHSTDEIVKPQEANMIKLKVISIEKRATACTPGFVPVPLPGNGKGVGGGRVKGISHDNP
jgi:hypothetical protein